MNKYKIIALIGKSGAGKDSMMKEVLKKEPGLNKIINCTTRPPREYEKDGIDYFFLSEEDFAKEVLNFNMIEATLKKWLYGTTINTLDKTVVNIGVFNPDGVDALLEDPRLEVKVFYINVSGKERLIRQLNREKNPDIEEIFRRYKADEDDFCNLDFDYTELKNETELDFLNSVEIICSSI